MYKFEASKTFRNNLKDISKIYLDIDNKNKEYEIKDVLLLKSIVILLGTSFEVYCEELIEEFITDINKNIAKSSQIPKKIKQFQANYWLEKKEKTNPKKNNGDNNKPDHADRIKQLYIETIIDILDTWNCDNPKLDILENTASYKDKDGKTQTISVSTINKFNYGSHGSKEVKDLLKRIGIENISGIEHFEDNFNSFIATRNSMVHSTGASINISKRDVRQYKIEFVKAIAIMDKMLLSHLNTIINIPNLEAISQESL